MVILSRPTTGALGLIAVVNAPNLEEERLMAAPNRQNLRQFTAVEAGRHDGAAGKAGGRGDEAVEQTGVFDFVAPAKRFDNALDMASTLTDVLDEVEILVAADLLDTDEHGWCPGSPVATTEVPRSHVPHHRPRATHPRLARAAQHPANRSRQHVTPSFQARSEHLSHTVCDSLCSADKPDFLAAVDGVLLHTARLGTGFENHAHPSRGLNGGEPSRPVIQRAGENDADRAFGVRPAREANSHR